MVRIHNELEEGSGLREVYDTYINQPIERHGANRIAQGDSYPYSYIAHAKLVRIGSRLTPLTILLIWSQYQGDICANRFTFRERNL